MINEFKDKNSNVNSLKNPTQSNLNIRFFVGKTGNETLCQHLTEQSKQNIIYMIRLARIHKGEN